MSELATVRAEIKQWERSFKADHGKDPSIQDIKQLPHIAEKYRLYKRLSKAAAAPPSTPPRSHSHPSLLLSKPRAPAEPTSDLPSFNPFSPRKAKSAAKSGKGKQKDIFDLALTSHANPFVTPTKPKPKARAKPNQKPIQNRDPSPTPDELFPPISSVLSNPNSASASSSKLYFPPPQQPASALSRARKRLRGEPVSPSPNKDKRRRVVPPVTPPPPLVFPPIEPKNVHTHTETKHDDMGESFISDSPVKAPTGSKSFKVLFEDTVPPLVPLGKAKPLTRTKTATKLFGAPDPIIGSKRNGDHRTSAKRSLSDSESEITHESDETSGIQLVPPSPPPVGESQNGYKNGSYKNKGKGKAATVIKNGRKKAKVDDGDGDEDEDDESDEFTGKVKLVDRWARVRAMSETEEEEEELMAFKRMDNEGEEIMREDGEDEEGYEINLPQNLLQVLALSPSHNAAKRRDVEEERMAEGLLYGRVRGDASKGAEVWGVGEVDGEDVEGLEVREGDVDVDDEDEWEGEPVPWEIGAL